MATFLFRYESGDPASAAPVPFKEAWVAISGTGNADKAKANAKKLDEYSINFVPCLEAFLSDKTPPTRIEHNIFDSVKYDGLFRKFLVIATSAMKATGELDADLVSTFFLSPDLVKAIKLIKNSLTNELKEQHAKHKSLGAGPNYDIPLDFLKMLAWECYMLDEDMIATNLYSKERGIDSSHVVTDLKTNKIIFNFNERVYKNYIDALGYAKDNELYKAFESLWIHILGFTIDALTKKMQHCAETNLIAFMRDELSKGDGILGRPGQFILFSSLLNDESNAVAAPCDNCRLLSLPEIFKLNVSSGDSKKKASLATIPAVSITEPRSAYGQMFESKSGQHDFRHFAFAFAKKGFNEGAAVRAIAGLAPKKPVSASPFASVHELASIDSAFASMTIGSGAGAM
ncbi:MAG: hypothetical protein Q7V63_00595 [Gammaproteobacteria bacterium]|nr:hypothetical protein [Gammaproteobacteria bacterium]